jgi:hypothetical protein
VADRESALQFRVSVVDQGYVPISPASAYAYLEDLESYGSWWPGTRMVQGDDGVALGLEGFDPVRVRTERHRPGVGVVLRFGGPAYAGSLEWYLEPFREGTIVNAIVEVEPRRRWRRRRVMRYRTGIRRGLVGLREAGVR